MKILVRRIFAAFAWLAPFFLHVAMAASPATFSRSASINRGIDGKAFLSVEDRGIFRVGFLVVNQGSSQSRFFVSIQLAADSCGDGGIEKASDASMDIPQEKFNASAIVDLPRGATSLWLQPFKIVDRAALSRCAFDLEVWNSVGKVEYQRRVNYDDLKGGYSLKLTEVPRLLASEVNKANGRHIIAILAPKLVAPWEKRLVNCGNLALESNRPVLGFDELDLEGGGSIIFGLVRSRGEPEKKCQIAISSQVGSTVHRFPIKPHSRYIDMAMNPDWGFRVPKFDGVK